MTSVITVCGTVVLLVGDSRNSTGLQCTRQYHTMKDYPFPNASSTHMRNADLGGPQYAPKGTSMSPEAP